MPMMLQRSKLLAAALALRRQLVNRKPIMVVSDRMRSTSSTPHLGTSLVSLQAITTQPAQCRGSSTASTSSAKLFNTSLQPLSWLLNSIQGSQGPTMQQAEACRTSSSCGRGLALAAVARTTDGTAGSGPASAPASAAARQLSVPTEASPHHSAAWQHVLQLLQQDSEAGGSSSCGDALQSTILRRQQQQHQHWQGELAAALAAATADQRGPAAQQLLQLLLATSKAQHEHQHTPSGLLLMLIEAAVASLPKLPPHQFAEVLPLIKGLQSVAVSSSTSAGKVKPKAPADRVNAERNKAQQAPSLSQLQLQPPAVAKTPRQQAAVLTKAVRVYLQQQQQHMDASDTAAVAAALAASKQHSSFTILSMLALEHMADMTPVQMVQLLQAFADVQHYNIAVCNAAAQQAVEAIKQQGYKLQPPADLVATASKQQQQQQQQQHGFTASQLTSVLQALCRLRHYDSSLLEAACTCLLRSPLREFEDMVSLVHTCAVLNHYHQPLFSTAVDMATQAMQQQEQHQWEHESGGSSLGKALAELSWACGVMGHWHAGFVHQLVVWSAQMDVKRLPAEELLLWHEVQTSLTDAVLLKPRAAPDGLSSSLVVAAQAAWAQRQQGRRLTAFQKEVVEALQQAAVRCKLNVALDGPVVVDVALQQRQVGARYRVALQLHPHEDFAANPPHGALGPTAARWRSLQARGWRVVTLQQSEWRRLKTKQQQVEYAWQLSQGVEVSAPGMPHLVHQVVVDKGKTTPRKTSLPKTLLRILLEGH